MRKRWSILVAVLFAGSVALWGCERDPAAERTAPAPGPPVVQEPAPVPDRDVAVDPADPDREARLAAQQEITQEQRGEIAQALDEVVSTALTADRDVVEQLSRYFTPADRQRIEQAERDEQAAQQLQEQAQQFRTQWEQDFERLARDEQRGEQIFRDAQIQVADAARQGVEAEPAAEREPGEMDRQHVQLQFEQEQDVPAFTVRLVREQDQWLLDIPDTKDRAALKQSLTTHLQRLNQERDQWGEQETDAYRHAAHHILAALYGEDPQQMDGMQRNAQDERLQ